MYINKQFLIVFLLLGSFNLLAQNVVKYGNDFLSIGVGARAHGMGQAVVANTQGGNAGYWNPAGLVRTSTPFQFNIMHAEWLAGVAKYDYASFVNIIGKEKKSAFGVTVIRLGIDNIPYTFELVRPDGSIDPEQVTGFSYADYAGLVSYAKKINNKFRLGANAKIIHRTAGRFGKAWGFGVDIGMQYQASKQIQLGLMARDISSTFNAWSYNYTQADILILQNTGNVVPVSSVEIIPPRIILGAAYTTRKTGEERMGLLLETDFDFTTDGQRNVLLSSKYFNVDASLGMEADYKQTVFLRAGINNFQKIKNDEKKESLALQPNFGIGIKIGAFNIDYAFNNVGSAGAEQTYYSHIFSLAINLNKRNKNRTQIEKPREKVEFKPKNKKDKDGFPDYIEQID